MVNSKTYRNGKTTTLDMEIGSLFSKLKEVCGMKRGEITFIAAGNGVGNTSFGLHPSLTKGSFESELLVEPSPEGKGKAIRLQTLKNRPASDSGRGVYLYDDSVKESLKCIDKEPEFRLQLLADEAEATENKDV